MHAASRTWHRSSSISRAFGFRRAGKIPLRFSPPLVGTPDVPSPITIADRAGSFPVGVTLRFVIAIASSRTWKMPSRAIALTRHSDLRPHPDLAIGERFGFAWHRASDRSGLTIYDRLTNVVACTNIDYTLLPICKVPQLITT